MNWRWYITSLIIALAFLGISLGQSATGPNQEIVVRFNTESITDSEAEIFLSEITDQLEKIGVASIQISDILDGELKITYYSTLDAGVIKNLLYNQNGISLGKTVFPENGHSSNFPFGHDSQTFRLDVIKIQNDFGSDLGFHGLLVELKSGHDQYVKPKISQHISEVYFSINFRIEDTSCGINQNLVFPISKVRHKIPEVRAGPIA